MKGLAKLAFLGALALPAPAEPPGNNPRLCVVAEAYLAQQAVGLPASVDFVQRLNRMPYNVVTAEQGWCRVNYSAPPGRMPIYAETSFRQNLGFLRHLPGRIFKYAGHLDVTAKS